APAGPGVPDSDDPVAFPGDARDLFAALEQPAPGRDTIRWPGQLRRGLHGSRPAAGGHHDHHPHGDRRAPQSRARPRHRPAHEQEVLWTWTRTDVDALTVS